MSDEGFNTYSSSASRLVRVTELLGKEAFFMSSSVKVSSLGIELILYPRK